MSRLTQAVVVALTLASLGACSRPEPPRTVAYYLEHAAERDARIALCKNDPGTLKDDPDCVNAASAAIRRWGTATLPPISFASGASASAR